MIGSGKFSQGYDHFKILCKLGSGHVLTWLRRHQGICLSQHLCVNMHVFSQNICMSELGVHFIQFNTLLTYKLIGVVCSLSACKLQ